MRTWFFFGVLIYGTFAAIRVLMFAGALAKSVSVVTLAHILSMALFLISIFWTLDGTVVRFSHTGRVCSGDYLGDLNPPETDTHLYLPKSGAFMKYYLVVSWVLTAIFFVFFIFCCSITCCIIFSIGKEEVDKDDVALDRD